MDVGAKEDQGASDLHPKGNCGFALGATSRTECDSHSIRPALAFAQVVRRHLGQVSEDDLRHARSCPFGRDPIANHPAKDASDCHAGSVALGEFCNGDGRLLTLVGVASGEIDQAGDELVTLDIDHMSLPLLQRVKRRPCGNGRCAGGKLKAEASVVLDAPILAELPAS